MYILLLSEKLNIPFISNQYWANLKAVYHYGDEQAPVNANYSTYILFIRTYPGVDFGKTELDLSLCDFP
jgi:hypothetical protein